MATALVKPAPTTLANRLPRCLRANAPVSRMVYQYAIWGWLGLLLAGWIFGAASYLPGPFDVLNATMDMWQNDGLGFQLWTSWTLSLEAATIMAIVAGLVAYSTALPANYGAVMQPFARLISNGRFNGLVGLPLIFMAMLHNPHRVQLALLVFGTGVFTLLSMLQVIQDIPKEAYDHARTLRMSEWRVVWEVVILGQFHRMLDIFQINLAMLWMMLPMVEGMYRSEGGVGALLMNESRQFRLDSVFAIVGVVMALGWLQDLGIGYMSRLVCPYARLGKEKS